jgi:hypothetical protein
LSRCEVRCWPLAEAPWPTGGALYWGAAAMGSTLSAGRAQCKPADRFDCYGALRQLEKLQAQARGATVAPPLGPESPGNAAGASATGYSPGRRWASERSRSRPTAVARHRNARGLGGFRRRRRFRLAQIRSRRLARVGARQADASDADAAVVRAQEAYDLGRNDWTVLEASGTPDETLARAVAALEAKSASSAR